MIEIRTDHDAEPASPDGPQDHEQTRAIAAGIVEAFRLLNHATLAGSGGLAYPSDVYSVFGALSAAVNRLPQALSQMERWVAAEVSEGCARENPDYGGFAGNAEAAHAALKDAVITARGHAAGLALALAAGQAAIRGLESTRWVDQGGEDR